MDKTRVVCIEKALFSTKFNIKVVNSIANGGQYDTDSPDFCFYQTNFVIV